MWDSQNRLYSSKVGNVTSTYTYGADGLRRSSTVKTDTGNPATTTVNTTYYAYDGQSCVQEEVSSLAHGGVAAVPQHLTMTYLMGPLGPECRIDETNLNAESYYLPHYAIYNPNDPPHPFWGNPNPADGSPYGSRGKTSWYVYDGLGSVVRETDFNGNLTTSAKYDVYGAKRAGDLCPTPLARTIFGGHCSSILAIPLLPRISRSILG